ncbi:DNA-binding response regulator [Mucilaginibacter sp. UR6-1]|uniref:response regulator transcription factor n=1 Tax=Mucilaginibacter sp. UR6-1 TaxID=1435643 RepID=UPI001E42AA38|nr:DNA-binding response regulator [Mucilaginibacter sp. UR6-1]MCC8408576.1 DNA-binding response regulator [Mucilaginibacter sp. UR6-1]
MADQIDDDHISAVEREQTHYATKRPTLLIVEDSDDFRYFLKDSLLDEYNIVEAVNGKDGWQKALFCHPNLIISDIAMPVMDGIALCNKVKNDSRTFHIPMILLTAANTEESEINGLGSGAIDYITKPFRLPALQRKIRNIIKQQEAFRQTYQKVVEIKPSQVDVQTPDEEFLQQVILTIEQNISNTNFSVAELSASLLISRSTLYNRILELTGKAPLDFIKSFRLKRGSQLIDKRGFTISQVCYKVGFKSPKTFVKAFKSEFGVIPSKFNQDA